MSPATLIWLLAASPIGAVSEATPTMNALRENFLETSAWIVEAAKRIPPERFDFRPAASVRTVGQLLGHIVDGNTFFCGKAAGKNPEWVETVSLSGASKPALIEKLEASAAECAGTFQESNAPRVAELIANLGHVSLHYGNLVTYLRILGITPPSS